MNEIFSDGIADIIWSHGLVLIDFYHIIPFKNEPVQQVPFLRLMIPEEGFIDLVGVSEEFKDKMIQAGVAKKVDKAAAKPAPAKKDAGKTPERKNAKPAAKKESVPEKKAEAPAKKPAPVPAKKSEAPAKPAAKPAPAKKPAPAPAKPVAKAPAKPEAKSAAKAPAKPAAKPAPAKKAEAPAKKPAPAKKAAPAAKAPAKGKKAK